MRKIIILAIILFFCIPFVNARYQTDTARFTLEEGQSAELNGKRLTLLNLDFEKERVIVCVNGEKTILSSKTKEVNGAVLDLRKVTMNKADIRMWVNCPGCECDKNCDNSVCFDQCYEDEDCDDGNALTEDKCYGSPKKCHNQKTKECILDEHCDDGNEYTIDKCSELLKKCVHTEKTIYKEEIKEINEQITGNSVINISGKYAKKIHPLLLSITFGFMIIAVIIKKFRH